MQTRDYFTRLLNLMLTLSIFLVSHCNITLAATNLADTPVLAVGTNIPGNVALALSVEFPTAVTSSYRANYDLNQEFLGYFDPNKCYAYQAGLITPPYNTGVDDNRQLLANGVTDPHWSVSPQPNTMNKVNTGIGMPSRGTGQAIGGSPNNNGTFSYTTTFNIPIGIDPKTVILTFELAHDDAATVYVNNSATGYSYSNYNPANGDPEQITLNQSNSNFVVGSNTIKIDITNGGGGGAGLVVSNMTATTIGTTDASQSSYFYPTNAATNHTCSGKWSGNLLNWALTQVIDSFRSTMTGGYRSVDTSTMTILEKAWFPPPTFAPTAPSIENNQTLIGQSTPYTNLNSLYIDFQCAGNNFYFSGTSSSVGNSFPGGYLCAPFINAPLVLDNALPAAGALPSTTNIYQMRARVKVCDASVGLEANCVKYGSNYKPEGLLQKYSKNLNYAAIAYVNENGIGRQGAALRAKMAPIGPNVASPNGDIANTAEWDTTTGIYKTNPASSDISSSDASMGVNNSGLLNYVNKFGLASKKYKFEDPVGELYYATLRYIKNQSYVPEYTNGLDSTKLDGFPAIINNWNINPIKYACQRNFILGLGDTNSNRDANVPGAIANEAIGYGIPIPAAVANDNTVNARTSTNKLGVMENVGYGNALADINYPWGFTGTYRIAGLAYDAHINDISTAFAGTQTVTTYWLDVLESGDRFNQGGTGWRNQFWLTAKYGGFTGSNPATGALALSQWDTDNNGDPDTYFRANNPLVMKTSLEKAFSNIINTVLGSSIAFATSSPFIQSGSLSYASSYFSGGWTGDVIAKTVNIDSNGILSVSSPVWNAAAKLESQASGTGWNSGRVIATASTQASGCSTTNYTASSLTTTTLGNGCGTPFRLGNLSSVQKTALTSVSANQQSLLDFLRGDRSNAGTQGLKLYRDRLGILGDIVNAKVVPVGAPNKPYTDTFNPGYASFKSSYINRPTVVYAGANDGMLHAFNGSASGGNELFAYVPNALFQGPSIPATPATDGLAQLSNTSYVHRYYVDATPQVADVDFGNKGALGGVGAVNWRTLLVGGLGKGGRSYFAIDVTNPSDAGKPNPLTSETNLASAVRWEFSHPLMGFTYDTPLTVKTIKYGWVVVLTSGYNNVDGKGYIFIVDPQTGALKENPIATNVGSVANDAGLAHINAFVADARSGLADALYAADLLGNLWRVDLTGTTGNYTALKIATLADANGTAQPVTTSPVIEVDISTGKRFVFVGTGKLLDSSDINSTQTQTFYAINDGTLSNFYTATTLPSVAGGFPITRDDMVRNSDLIAGFSADATKPMGYYIDLDVNPNNGKTNFISTELATASGIVAFAANSIDNSDVCSPKGSNLTFALSYGTGRSVLTDANGNFISNIAGTGLSASLNFVQGNFYDPNSLKLINSSDGGAASVFTPKSSSSTKPFTQLNWRELPTAD